MAGGSSEDRWRRPTTTSRCHADLRDDDPEEGEVVPGYHSDADTDEYYNRHGCSSSDSDETVSDSNAVCSVPVSYGRATSPCSVAANSDGGSAGSSSPVAARAALACPVCGKEFRSQKAVCGHMKVHAIGGQEQGNGRGKGIKRVVAAVASWGGTGKRGCSGLGGSRPASTNDETDQSMAIVVAESKIVLQPKPLAFATPNLSSVPMASAAPIQSSVPMTSSMATPKPNPSTVSMASASPNLSPVPLASAMTNVSGQSSSAQPMHKDAMETVVAGPANPPSEAVVHPHAAPPTPPAEREQAPSTHQHPMAPPPPAPAAGRQNPNGYTCKECNEWFPTHQGLGGHVAAHRSREDAAAAEGALEDGAAPCRRDARPEKKAHVCKVCGAAFPAGVQLGGHMRKHYAGPPIVPNKKPRLVHPHLPPPALTLALPASAYADGASPAPTVEAAAPAVETTPEPAPGPAVAARVLLFGIDIGVRVQKPAAQEGPSATQGPASTGGEQ